MQIKPEITRPKSYDCGPKWLEDFGQPCISELLQVRLQRNDYDPKPTAFKDEWVLPHIPPVPEPTAEIAVTRVTRISASMTAYSTAVAADSSLKKDKIRISNPRSEHRNR